MTFRYFSLDEFACRCCGKNLISPSFVAQLDNARGLAGAAFKITSGYRCPEHNKAVGGELDSAHRLGLAADIAVTTSRNRMRVVDALLQAGFGRIGIAKTFVHADVDENKPQGVIWVYK